MEHFLFIVHLLQQSTVIPGYTNLQCEIKYLQRFYCNWKLFIDFFVCVCFLTRKVFPVWNLHFILSFFSSVRRKNHVWPFFLFLSFLVKAYFNLLLSNCKIKNWALSSTQEANTCTISKLQLKLFSKVPGVVCARCVNPGNFFRLDECWWLNFKPFRSNVFISFPKIQLTVVELNHLKRSVVFMTNEWALNIHQQIDNLEILDFKLHFSVNSPYSFKTCAPKSRHAEKPHTSILSPKPLSVKSCFLHTASVGGRA